VIRKNIRFFYALVGCQALSLGLIWPAYVLYFRHYHVTLFEVATLAAVFEASIIIFELPTGILADKIGRKPSTSAGFAAYILSGGAFIFLQNFEGFLLAEVLFGLGESLISGALDALAVDSAGQDYNDSFGKRLFSNKARVKSGALLVGMLGGGALAGWDLPVLFYPITIIFIAGLLLSFLLTEPQRIAKESGKENKKTKRSVKEIVFASGLGPLFAVGLMANFAFEGPDQFWQVQFSEVMLVNAYYFGLLTAAGLLIVALIARWTEKFYDHLGVYLLACFIIVAAGVWGVATGKAGWAVAGIIGVFAVKELFQPAISYRINSRIGGANRATVLSGYNLTCSIGEVAAALLAGIIAARHGLITVFHFAAISAILVPILYRAFKRIEARAVLIKPDK